MSCLTLCSGTGSRDDERSATRFAVDLALRLERSQGRAGILLVRGSRPDPLRPALLASPGATSLERDLRAIFPEEIRLAARGRVCFCDPGSGAGPQVALEAAAQSGAIPSLDAIVAWVEPAEMGDAWELAGEHTCAVLLSADLRRDRGLLALCAQIYRSPGCGFAVDRRRVGAIDHRRLRVGLPAGGSGASAPDRLAAWLVSRVATERGQVLPGLIVAMAAVLAAASVAVALGGALTGKAAVQRMADLAALSAAHSMRDQFPRLFAPRRLPDGRPNPSHLSHSAYLDQAARSARSVVAEEGVGDARVRIRFPGQETVPALRVRVGIRSGFDADPREARAPVWAVAELSPGAAAPLASAPSEGDYRGVLVRRQGKRMRPDVAGAFDRLEAAAAAAGHHLIISSAFRSDAEQAALFAANPDPRWVARPGTSLHRCGTELDLGPPSAHGWLAAHAERFGFLRRYDWEPWHFGYTGGPPPCSQAATLGGATPGGGGGRAKPGGSDGADGVAAASSLPDWVPARFRAPIARAASRWNVGPDLLAAQLLAESNFDPTAVSPAGAVGIAQFMPATAAGYGLRDRFDPEASIWAQARFMADLLATYDGSVALALAAYNAGPGAVDACRCIPPYPETRAYVTRILGLLDGSGQSPGLLGAADRGGFEVRLVE